MTTFVLVHGGGTGGSTFELLEEQLRARGHDVIAPDMPIADGDLDACADAVVSAIPAGATDVVVVGHSFGAVVAPLVCTRRDARELVLVAPMIIAPGEHLGGWWEATKWAESAPDPQMRDTVATFIADASPELAERELAKEREHGAASFEQIWPLHGWPDVPTRVLAFADDNCFPLEFQRRLARERLDLEPEVLPGSHMAYATRAEDVAVWLVTGRASQP